MWRRAWEVSSRQRFHTSASRFDSRPVINIDNGTFYERYPSGNTHGSNPAILSGLNFSLPNQSTGEAQKWAVISPSSIARTSLLQVLAGQFISVPPQARTYPYLTDISRAPQDAIKYVGFDAERGNSVGGTDVRGAYLSARYESRREETDYSVLDYLTGHTELNALEREASEVDKHALKDITSHLRLHHLLQMPVANLSNGQTRRARIAKALMARPDVLLVDGPFMGLDPNTLVSMSAVLQTLAERQQPRLIMSLRPEDGVPDWVSHLIVIDASQDVVGQGAKDDLLRGHDHHAAIKATLNTGTRESPVGEKARISRDGFPQIAPSLNVGEALVELNGVRVSYGDKCVLGDWQQPTLSGEKAGLWWSLHRGQRCGIFGANGSGKTTMLSLITSDHPQTYSLPIKLFGRSRLPGPGQPGISIFDIQRRMGHSSPEVHAFFPKQLTVRRVLESAWADAPLSKATLPEGAWRRVNACLRWFARELNPSQGSPTALEILEAAAAGRSPASKDATMLRKVHEEVTVVDADLIWADQIRLRDLSFSNQRLVLFLRALVASPDLIILDEALSGVDEAVRDKALLFLSQGENVSRVVDDAVEESPMALMGTVCMEGLSQEQALLVISHTKEDVPGCVREWICLPEPGEGKAPRTGALRGPLQLNPHGWEEIWGG